MTPVTYLLRLVGQSGAALDIYKRLATPLAPLVTYACSSHIASHCHGLTSLVLTTTGAQTNRMHRTPLLYVRHRTSFVVVGTNFGSPSHPQWTRNLTRQPKASIRVASITLTVSAETVDPALQILLMPKFITLFPPYRKYISRRETEPRMFLLHPCAPE